MFTRADSSRRFHTLGPDELLLSVQHAEVRYPARAGSGRGDVKAVDDVSFSVTTGRSLALVGESGCGKTTIGRSIVDLVHLTAGTMSVAERPPSERLTPRSATHRLAKSVQMVFQDPYSSLDPRQSVGSAIEEPMRVHRVGTASEREDRVGSLLERVGLSSAIASRFPHELSGGQRQRVCIARALAVEPLFVVCDEPTSALDVSIQAQVVELLQHLQVEDGLTYLFISHDLALLPQLVSNVAVMYLGRLVEKGPVMDVLQRPHHPYTVSLIAAVPVLGRRREAAERMLKDDLPTDALTQGCPFRPRCWLYRELDGPDAQRCRQERPELSELTSAGGHAAACHFQSAISPNLPALRPGAIAGAGTGATCLSAGRAEHDVTDRETEG